MVEGCKHIEMFEKFKVSPHLQRQPCNVAAERNASSACQQEHESRVAVLSTLVCDFSGEKMIKTEPAASNPERVPRIAVDLVSKSAVTRTSAPSIP